MPIQRGSTLRKVPILIGDGLDDTTGDRETAVMSRVHREGASERDSTMCVHTRNMYLPTCIVCLDGLVA